MKKKMSTVFDLCQEAIPLTRSVADCLELGAVFRRLCRSGFFGFPLLQMLEQQLYERMLCLDDERRYFHAE